MKKNASTLVLVFVLTAVCHGSQLVVLTFANVFPSPPTADVYIRDDGSVMPSHVPIQKNGNVYVFTGDLLRHILSVECDNIIVDGAGFTLKNAYALNELLITGQKNVTIKNLNMGGVYVHLSSSVTISNCDFRTVMLRSSCYNQIVGNIVGSVEINSGSDYNIVVRNEIVSGVTIKDGNYTTVSGNRFTNCLTSVFVYSSHNIISKNNILNEKNYGTIVITSGGSCNTVFGNNITTPLARGIAITEGCNNVVYENNLLNCAAGVSLGSSDRRRVVANNTIYRNNFVNNTNDVGIGYIEGSNVFDNGSEGNYWSRYNGTDIDGNGICDTPYIVHANFTDNYPLMYRYVSGSDITSPVVVVSPENCTYTTNEITLTFSSNKTLTWTAYRLDAKNMKEFDKQTTLSSLSDGTHNITVYAKDTAGNMLASKTVYFQIDANQNLPLYVVAVGAVATCILVGVFIRSLRKTKHVT